jgi:predicted enzyme related to lactoylglutathione lyase
MDMVTMGTYQMFSPDGDWVVNAADPQGATFGLHAKKAQ